MIGIIDYNLCNINSIYNAVEKLTNNVKILKDGSELKGVDKIILPGVGSFPAAVRNLKKQKLFDHLKIETLDKRKPILGICLGMQLLFEESSEDELTTGLGIIKGKVIPLKSNENFKVPNMGWKKINFIKKSVLLRDISTDPIFYFVHKFGCFSKDNNILVSRSLDIQKFDCLIEKKNIFATQFHPEKSQTAGFDLLKNFINYKNI
jgi:imidazole glycerol-phosphate synthase subunit HisH